MLREWLGPAIDAGDIDAARAELAEMRKFRVRVDRINQEWSAMSEQQKSARLTITHAIIRPVSKRVSLCATCRAPLPSGPPFPTDSAGRLVGLEVCPSGDSLGRVLTPSERSSVQTGTPIVELHKTPAEIAAARAEIVYESDIKTQQRLLRLLPTP